MGHYYYLISSLPTLKRDETPFFSTASFMTLCAEHLGAEEMKKLEELTLTPPDGALAKLSPDSFSAKWYEWETYFRNKISRIRTALLQRGSNKSLRSLSSDLAISEIDRAVSEQLLSMNPADKERTLDNLRWTKLDELELSHYFDFDMLCSYKLKLLIREKWQKRDMVKGKSNLNSIVDKIYSE